MSTGAKTTNDCTQWQLTLLLLILLTSVAATIGNPLGLSSLEKLIHETAANSQGLVSSLSALA